MPGFDFLVARIVEMCIVFVLGFTLGFILGYVKGGDGRPRS